jgi:hypothetical protein
MIKINGHEYVELNSYLMGTKSGLIQGLVLGLGIGFMIGTLVSQFLM